MAALFRRGLIAQTNEGSDGIGVFVPVKPMSVLGLKVVRLGGWQGDPDGGAMFPFHRGPGTAPPNFIFVVVAGTEQDVRKQLSARSINEEQFVPDETQPRNESGGPYRRVPGAAIEAGNHYVFGEDLPNGVTIECSASESDFVQDIQARLKDPKPGGR